MPVKNVTVLIPSYNHAGVLTFQIESLLAQTCQPRKIVVLDDASTDDTAEVLEKYSQNRGIKVLRHDRNAGVHAALTRLLQEVDTEYFAFAAADDMLTRDWCATTTALLDAHPSAKMAISNTFIYGSGQIWVTNSIVPVNGESEGIYESKRFGETLLKCGKLPPSNVVLYRSEIIEDLIKPIICRRELAALIDVFLIVAIGERHTIAYSTTPTGVFVKNDAGYGSSLFGRKGVEGLLENMKRLAAEHGYITDTRLLSFFVGYVKYTWIKDSFSIKPPSVKEAGGRCKYAALIFVQRLRMALYFIVYRKIRFLKYGQAKSKSSRETLSKCIDAKLFARLR